jgi:hypothetical protein
LGAPSIYSARLRPDPDAAGTAAIEALDQFDPTRPRNPEDG